MVRTRFAPSPTGSLHIGGVRTALYCYAMARKNNGVFILRIEDTDQTRYVQGSIEEIYEMLKLHNLEPDESSQKGGDFGPYIQSQRLDIYKKYAEELIENGTAYYCFATKEEIDNERKAAQEAKKPFVFRSQFRDMDKDEAKNRIKAGGKYVIRQKIPAGEVLDFHDEVQGDMKFHTDDVDDTVLLKSDGFPTYHLAMAVDDHLMQISHVFRGAEWLPSIPKHVLLFKAFGWEMPKIAHLSAVLDPAGGKLSKRKGSVAAKEFLSEGYLPEAMLNFLMLLGWSSPEKHEHGATEREFFSLNEFVELFDIKNLNKSNPVFNREKLIWFNQKYIANLTPEEVAFRFKTWINCYGRDKALSELNKRINEGGNDYLINIIKLIKDRIKLLSDIPPSLELFYFQDEENEMKWQSFQLRLKTSPTKDFLVDYNNEYQKFKTMRNWSHEDWEKTVRNLAEKHGMKARDAFMSLREVILKEVSPPLYESMQLLKDETIQCRLDYVINKERFEGISHSVGTASI